MTHPRRYQYRAFETNDPDALPIRPERGYVGAFTRATAPGAIPAGARCRKANSEPGDANPDGALGRVLGSIQPPPPLVLCYFVEWDASPRRAVAVLERKVKAA